MSDKVKKIGIILPALYSSQLAYETFNAIHKSLDWNVDPIIFFEDFSSVFMRPPCPIMNVIEILSFNGTLISTNLSNTAISLKAINMAKKIFYVWDLEWLRGNSNYLYNISLYQNPELKLITRSDSYASELNNYANMKPEVSSLENLICSIAKS